MTNSEMTAEIPKQEQIEVQVHENTSVEATTQNNEEIPPASGLGIGSGNTGNTEQPQLEVSAASIPEQHQLVHAEVEQTVAAEPANHIRSTEVPNSVDTSVMISEAAASVVDTEEKKKLILQKKVSVAASTKAKNFTLAVGDVQLAVDAALAADFAVGDVQQAVDAALAADGNSSGGDAAAAVAAVAAASVKNEAMNVTDVSAPDLDTMDAETKKNEQRRKRYREKSVEEVVPPPSKKQLSANHSHEDQLASRRMKDRQRYANMTPEQRHIYNAKRREQYHRQSEASRQRRRERERERYHSLENEDAKSRNARRAKLERERYQRLNPEQLEAKNRKRRERAAAARNKKAQERNVVEGSNVSGIGAGATVSIQMLPAGSVNTSSSNNTSAQAVSGMKVEENAGPNTNLETRIVPVASVEQNPQQHHVEQAAVEAAAVAAVAAAQVEKQADNATNQAAVEAAVEAVDNHISV
eukprot:CAMPEP_0197179012 /NCGR_PEP_ID=MMETSP1423-20130617/4101_1 /TAXON_ID=476441 /ORGANISM="Pseudo-nitzschia heimii, Strain UNC1101" /LENGTH=469 /DNA_ID=CAMNT_0042628855 /DNA_START=156 /DNA_END=1565 /DNA_ORIENTATION=-